MLYIIPRIKNKVNGRFGNFLYKFKDIIIKPAQKMYFTIVTSAKRNYITRPVHTIPSVKCFCKKMYISITGAMEIRQPASFHTIFSLGLI